MKSEASVAALEEQGLGYLMAVQGRRNPEMEAALQAVREEAWARCEGADGRVLFFSLFQWILPNYSMNSSGRCSNWFTTAGEN